MLTLLCAVSCWGLDKDVALGLLCFLDYVVFPAGEGCAPVSSPLEENAQDGVASFRYREMNSTILASVRPSPPICKGYGCLTQLGRAKNGVL